MIENHVHNGIDSPKINPKNLNGFQILTAAPTYAAKEGTVLLANESGTYYLYARINKSWVKVQLS
jgi:hypothetical protein